MAFTAAELSAMQQGATQVDTHNATLRGVGTAIGNLQITGDYNTPAGFILATLLQDWHTKLTQVNTKLDNISTTLRGNATTYQGAKDAGVTSMNPILAALQGITGI